jgi:hypothetical protein
VKLENMFFLSLKSIISLSVLLIATGIGSVLYLTLNDDFEAQAKNRIRLRTSGSDPSKTDLPIGDIINAARQAWSIVDKK